MTSEYADPASYLRASLDAAGLDELARIEKAHTIYMASQRDEDLARNVKLLATNAVVRRNPAKPPSSDNRAPGKGFVLIAASGAGKSTLLEEAFRSNPAFPNFGVADTWCPLVRVGAPSPCTLGQLGIRILQALGYDLQRTIRENVVWLRVRQQLRANGILFLSIDDLQHVLHGSGEEEIQKVRDTLKDLMTNPEWPVQLILTGIPELLPFFRSDRQLRRRLRFMNLSKLEPKTDGGFLRDAVSHYAKLAGLELEVKDGSLDDLAGRLMHAGQREMGMTLEILSEAIEEAVERGGTDLTISDFANAYARRNLLPDDQNPFIAPSWHAIDTSRLQPRDLEEPDDTVTPVGRKRKGTKK